jgi:hypothetical protein
MIDISEFVRHFGEGTNYQLGTRTTSNTTGRGTFTFRYSSQIFLSGGERTQLEHFSKLTTTEFLHQIAFPQRESLLRFSIHPSGSGLAGEG